MALARAGELVATAARIQTAPARFVRMISKLERQYVRFSL
jgi:hypothetical protein